MAITRDDSEDVPEAMVSSAELDLDSENYTLLGESGEDQKKDNGESQTIAAMLILATKLGLKAAKRNITFQNAIIYGHTRTISTKSLVTPYRLHMDFKLRRYYILKSKTPMTASQYFLSLKFLLQNPEHMKNNKKLM